jgi:DNA-binding SARP family transcriptional activator
MRIQLCGETVIEGPDGRIDERLPGRQGRVLFAYLVLNRHRPVGRDELVEALWSGELPRATEAGLNALLSKLRRTLGPGVLEGRSNLRLRLPDGARIDVEIATEAAHRAESKIALGEWKLAWAPSLVALFVAEREFLPGEDAPWISDQRRRLDEIRLLALETYSAAALGTGGTELPAAIRAGQQLIAIAPLRESGYQLLMRSLAAQGNLAEALRIYTSLCDVLRDDLGVSPSPMTQAVYEQLIRS